MNYPYSYYVINYVLFTDRPLASHSYSHGAWSWCSVYSVMSKRNYDVIFKLLLRHYDDSYVQTFLIYDPTLSRISNYLLTQSQISPDAHLPSFLSNNDSLSMTYFNES